MSASQASSRSVAPARPLSPSSQTGGGAVLAQRDQRSGEARERRGQIGLWRRLGQGVDVVALAEDGPRADGELPQVVESHAGEKQTREPRAGAAEGAPRAPPEGSSGPSPSVASSASHSSHKRPPSMSEARASSCSNAGSTAASTGNSRSSRPAKPWMVLMGASSRASRAAAMVAASREPSTARRRASRTLLAPSDEARRRPSR